MKYKILIFTDSRGQHVPNGSDHKIFTELLAENPNIDADMFLCPMKWTTTLDFFYTFKNDELKKYDYIILYTGIVEWSPRPAKSVINDIYNNQSEENLSAIDLNTNVYKSKVVNNKKKIFDNVFGISQINKYLKNNLEVNYEGDKTNNMYSLEMAKNKLIPLLVKIPNLIFINSNKFVPNWEGDYKRGRPKNINFTEKYSELFANQLKNAGKIVVDLLKWDYEEVQKYTCDNLHLSEKGSNFIHDELIKIIFNKNLFNYNYRPLKLKNIEIINKQKKQYLLNKFDQNKNKLATLIIGYRYTKSNDDNLKFLLSWIDKFYGDLFDILIMEQDSKSKLKLGSFNKDFIRHEFIYNPKSFNRGWGFNVAVKHFCKYSKIIALMDTDILTGDNFLDCICECYGNYDVISPYQYVYYSDAEEVNNLRQDFNLSSIKNIDLKINNPVSISGGLVIFKKSKFLEINGFEQYIAYSCEDRAMDVTLLNHFPENRIKIESNTYVHQYHPKGEKTNFQEIYAHLIKNYKCEYDRGLAKYDYIHANCKHSNRGETLRLIWNRFKNFGDKNLYSNYSQLLINGQSKKDILKYEKKFIFPEEDVDFSKYKQKEVYGENSSNQNNNLDYFYNKYKGKRCFIVGNGPSLNNHDLSYLNEEYTFGVNCIFYKTFETGFKPTFYVVEDSSVFKENLKEINKYDVPFKFFPSIYKKYLDTNLKNLFFNMNRGFYEKSSPNYCIPRFSTDASKVLFCGQSVTYINLQLAFFMGFTEIYLIGMDFSYEIPVSHIRNKDVLLSDTDDINHFHKDYFGKGKTWKDPKLDRVLKSYKAAKLFYQCVGRSIYNASIGGKLEEFERVEYNNLFNFCNKEKKFSYANMLFRNGKYEDALKIYKELYKENCLDIYLTNAKFAENKISKKNYRS